MNNHNAPSFQFSDAKILPITTVYKFDAANKQYRQIEPLNNNIPERLKIAKRRRRDLQCDFVLERYELGKWKLFTGLQIVDNGSTGIGNRIVGYTKKRQKVTEALQTVFTPDKQQLFVYTFGGDYDSPFKRMRLARAFLHYLEKYGNV